MIRLAKRAVVGLLIFELLAYGIGYALSGALGAADDAKGPILLIQPLSIVVTLFLIWRFGRRLSVWILALLVLGGPFWSVALLGPASEHHFAPFWAEAAVIITWPIWGRLDFRRTRSAR
ncbi:MAG TPA: hypothetical protein VHY35_15735 [Stellaceae bacterium]|jgi:hypothetical protein|nr:hypothetical protein [Stellaceae bacterium]